jgi:rubrerythrin
MDELPTPLTDRHLKDSEDWVVRETRGGGLHVAAARQIERTLRADLDTAVALMNRLAGKVPVLQDSIHGPRWRCRQCGYAWVDGREHENHGEECAYVMARDFLRTAALGLNNP